MDVRFFFVFLLFLVDHWFVFAIELICRGNYSLINNKNLVTQTKYDMKFRELVVDRGMLFIFVILRLSLVAK